MNWQSFRESSESEWKGNEVFSNVYGYQIQRGTMWNTGLIESEILFFERSIGFVLPVSYKAMISEINGFD
jgi:hypothetical protein